MKKSFSLWNFQLILAFSIAYLFTVQTAFAEIKHRPLTLKGLRIGVDESIVRRIFPGLKCHEISKETESITSCNLSETQADELKIADYQAHSYKFDFSGGMLVGMRIFLDNKAFDIVKNLFTERYGHYLSEEDSIAENQDQTLNNILYQWQQNKQEYLAIEKYAIGPETMGIYLAFDAETAEAKPTKKTFAKHR
jgi:hypothetical protein